LGIPAKEIVAKYKKISDNLQRRFMSKKNSKKEIKEIYE
jgi:hypothetical protein